MGNKKHDPKKPFWENPIHPITGFKTNDQKRKVLSKYEKKKRIKKYKENLKSKKKT